MEEDQKPFIFEKREVALIFISMILMAFLSFTLGVKVGKSYTFKKEGFTKEDEKVLKLKSNLEEEIEAKVNIESSKDLEETKDAAINLRKLEEEFEKVEAEDVALKEAVIKKTGVEVEVRPRKEFKNKWTILLGTYRARDEAEKFADGFRIRGYEPVVWRFIQEVENEARGTIFRVSLGSWDKRVEAQEYILEQGSLFGPDAKNIRYVQFE